MPGEAKTNTPPPLPLPLIIRPMQNEIQAFKGNGEEHVVYELMVSNLSQNPIRIKAIHILGKECLEGISSLHSASNKCRIIYERTFQKKQLPPLFSLLGGGNRLDPQDPLIPAQASAILFLFLNFPSLQQVPDFLENGLSVEIEGQEASTQTIPSNVIVVNKSPPLGIHAPLEGKNWYAEAAPSNANYHRRTILVLNGNALTPERFAVDFIKYGPQGTHAGNPFVNRSYYGYGQKIFSVTDGTVVRVVDGIPENTPGTFPVSKNPETVNGNYILIKIDPTHYAFYAHFIPRSIKVEEGEKVKGGQLLGLLGNSGNSLLPHLHFQITDRPGPLRLGNSSPSPYPYPLNAQGIPWVFEHFVKENYLSIGKSPLDSELPLLVLPFRETKVRRQIVMDGNLVSFIP